jgi:hypothetical protein
MTEPTTSAQTRPETVEEQLKKLFARTAELGDRVAALINPAWGAEAGILPRTHPLHPETRRHARREAEAANAAAVPQSGETAAPVDWQAIAKQRERELKSVGEQKNTVEQERDGAYRERAHLVALLAALTPGAVITYATDVEEPGWQIVYLNLGDRQASWHISPRDADLFTHVERVEHEDPRGHWDGHTKEEKYEGITAWTAELMQQCGPDMNCPHCPDGHTPADQGSQPWNAHLGRERDGDGQPTTVHVARSAGAHVAESDAEWIRQRLNPADNPREPQPQPFSGTGRLGRGA